MELEDDLHGSPDQASMQRGLSSSVADTQNKRTQRNLPWMINNERGSRYFCPVSDCPHAEKTVFQFTQVKGNFSVIFVTKIFLKMIS